MMRSWLVVLVACGGGGAKFRTYTPPPPQAREAPTPASEACIAPDRALLDHEDARENAAMDAELRRHGGMLLSAMLLPKGEERGEREDDDEERHPTGSFIRGHAGERWLVVGETSACNPSIPLVAIDAHHEVFVAERGPRAAETRKIQFCQPLCGGCGIKSRQVPIVVEVPEGAHLGQPRGVFYPIDVHVEFHWQGKCEPVP